MEAVVNKAWRQRIALLVITEEHEPHEPHSVVFLRVPSED